MKQKLKITCNPYTREITYKYGKGDNWIDVDSENNKLTSYTKKEFSDIANDVVKLIYDQKYEMVEFEGTKDDFEELQYASKTVPKLENKEDIKPFVCIASEMHFNKAGDVIGPIGEEFKNLNTILDKKYKVQNDDIKKEIEKFEKTVTDEIPLVVMGTYSSGKSSFINALIGYEILPSGIKTTTARTHKIRKSASKDAGRISFNYDGEPVTIKFHNAEIAVEPDSKDFSKKLLNAIKENSKDDSIESHIFQALTYLNEQEGQNEHLSELIDIECPSENGIFNNTQFNFTVLDTPGSDSADGKTANKHFEILKNALNNQTNGLPIFVTPADRMNSAGNKEILSELEDINLDKNNMIIIVNQADKLTNADIKDLIDGKDKDVIREYQSTRIFFVSSIAGLAGQKKADIDFYNKGYKEVFDDVKNKFTDKTNQYYKQLYKCNVMPDLQKKEYCESVVENGNEKKKLFANSGLECVVAEVFSYGEKHALYNKCAKAKEFLDNALSIVGGEIVKKKNELEAPAEEIRMKLDQRKHNIIQQIKEKANESSSKITQDYSKQLSSKFKELKEDKQKIIETQWGKEYKNKFNDQKKDEGISSVSFIKGWMEEEGSLGDEYKNAKIVFENSSDDNKFIRGSKQTVNVVKKGVQAGVIRFAEKLLAGIDEAKDSWDGKKKIRNNLTKDAGQSLLEIIKSIDVSLYDESRQYFENKDSDITDILIAVAKQTGVNELSDSDKEKIASVIQRFPKERKIVESDDILRDTNISRYLFGIDLGDLDYKKLVTESKKKLEELCENQVPQIEKDFKKNFNDWCGDLICTIEKEITSLNSELEDLSMEKERLTNEQNEFKSIEDNIKKSKEKLDCLLSLQEEK